MTMPVVNAKTTDGEVRSCR